MRQWSIHRETQYYFCTTTVTDWYPLFNEDDYCDIILGSLSYCRLHKGLKLHAYVLMPDHLHLIVSCTEGHSLPDIMRDFKRYTSRKCTSLLRKKRNEVVLNTFRKAAVAKRDKQIYKVWQNGYHPIGLYTEPFLKQKLDYLHENPVRKAYVSTPEEWVYSSARNYASLPDFKIPIDRF